jgi:hypothetical protein
MVHALTVGRLRDCLPHIKPPAQAAPTSIQEHPPERATMGTVMIRCPKTGREISTGYEADPARFGTTPVFFSRSHCPFCRTEHEWFAQEAWVCESAR